MQRRSSRPYWIALGVLFGVFVGFGPIRRNCIRIANFRVFNCVSKIGVLGQSLIHNSTVSASEVVAAAVHVPGSTLQAASRAAPVSTGDMPDPGAPCSGPVGQQHGKGLGGHHAGDAGDAHTGVRGTRCPPVALS